MSGFACPHCRHTLGRTTRGTPRKILCATCRFVIYDYPRVCAGAVVLRDDRVLVLRRASAPRKGCLDIPGGFVDANEAIEHAARRELREETGLRVGRMEPLGSYWDRYYLRGFGYFPTLSFYFIARWRSGTPVAADDAASAEWAPIAAPGKVGRSLAFKHMAAVFRDLKRQVTARSRQR